jgi:hypothetical protein
MSWDALYARTARTCWDGLIHRPGLEHMGISKPHDDQDVYLKEKTLTSELRLRSFAILPSSYTATLDDYSRRASERDRRGDGRQDSRRDSRRGSRKTESRVRYTPVFLS